LLFFRIIVSKKPLLKQTSLANQLERHPFIKNQKWIGRFLFWPLPFVKLTINTYQNEWLIFRCLSQLVWRV